MIVSIVGEIPRESQIASHSAISLKSLLVKDMVFFISPPMEFEILKVKVFESFGLTD